MLNAATNVDLVDDFEAGRDRIALDRDVFRVAAAALAMDQYKAIGTSGAKLDTEGRIIYDSRDGKLSYDADGSGGGAAVLFARIDSDEELTSTAFLVV